MMSASLAAEIPSRPRPAALQSSSVASIPQISRPPSYNHMATTPQPVRRPTSIAVDPVGLVVSECITVTSAMRKHARWAHSSVSVILGGGAGSNSAATGKSSPMPMSPMSPLVSPAKRGGKEGGPGAMGRRIKVGDGDSNPVESRWGLRGKKGKSLQDNPLMSAFARLRSDLKGCKDIRTFDTPSLLHPFLQVIRSSSTSAPITSLAVIAITKFLSYSIISRDSPRLPLAMQLLSSAITHCRFEASDAATDEVVLLRILKLMEGMISGPGGELLSDESICEMMECGLSMCCQGRLSELLRRSAEMAMVNMCQVIFERLKHLEIQAGDEPSALDEDTKDDMDGLKMEPSAVNGSTTTGLTVPGVQPPVEKSPSNSFEAARASSSDSAPEKQSASVEGSQIDLTAVTQDEDEEEEQAPIKPYSLPSIRELFRVLVGLLDPHDRQHNDTMRVMALRIVDVALEVAGPSIANHPSLASLAKDTLCRHLFQLVRSENMAILSESLRVAGTLLETCRSVLKLQQELFLSYLVACLFPRVEIPLEPGIEPSLYEGVPAAPSIIKPVATSHANSGRSTPVPVKDRQRLGLEGGTRKPDAREAMVENVGALVRMPSFMTELFVNYDCEIDRSDLCMDMVGLLARNAFPDSATWSTTNVPPLCLDALLSYVQFMYDRLEDDPVYKGYPDAERLREQREKKKIIVRGATKFNENPKGGVAFLASQGMIDDPDKPESIAKFLRGTTRIDKRVLGDFLSKRGNEAILKAFINTLDFNGQRIDEALRKLINSFRLPGEAPLIERVVVEFADQYIASDIPPGIADKDAAYVLTYAVIMLNTDQHNRNFRGQKRMAAEDFARNLRGTNGPDRGDFDPEYLEAIFNSIKDREIILAEEHDNKHSYDYAWQELLVKIQTEPDLAICDTNIFDADMFAATWRPIVATLSFVFMSASDDAVFERVLAGFHQCADIASKYELSDALDRMIFCLSYMSTLASETPPNTALNTEVQADQKSVMVSETAVKFGRDDRAQLATLTLFAVVKRNEATVRLGWDLLVRIMLNLFVNSLIPAGFSSIAAPINLPPIPLQSPAQVIERNDRATDTSLFSAFTSYVSSFANDEPPEPSDQEIEQTLTTVDTINDCNFNEIFANIGKMPVQSLKALLGSLLMHVPQDTEGRVIVPKAEVPPSNPAARQNGQKARKSNKQPAYDPTLVFVLELATALAIRDSETVEHLGKDVADALQTVIQSSKNMHSVVTSRAVYYLLSLLRASNDHDFIRAPVILHELSTFPADLQKDCASNLLSGIRDCITGPTALRSEMANSPDFWSILSTLHTVPDVAADVFSILSELAEPAAGRPIGISSDNYEAAIVLLNELATEGKVGAAEEQRRDREEAAVQGPKGGARKGAASSRPASKAGESKDASVTRGIKAVQTIYTLSSRVPHFIERSALEPADAWTTYWSPIFKALTNQSLNPCRAIRSVALTSLQRALLSPALTDSSAKNSRAWTATIFDEVLFPLVTRLLKPEVWQRDPKGMSESRVQAAMVLCKVFLHYLGALSEGGELAGLWGRILEVCDRLMNSGQGDNLEEALPESLKNILLVMSSGGYLAPENAEPTPNAQQVELWKETRKRLDRFLPGLCDEVFPDASGGGDTQTKAAEEKKEAEVEEKKNEDDSAQAVPDGQERRSAEVKGDDVD